jgi:hypothetical protein
VTAADVRGLFAELGVALPAGGPNVTVRCFADPVAHKRGDRSKSASVNVETGAWCCHGCGAKDGAYDAALASGRTPADAMQLLERSGLIDGDAGERPLHAREDAPAPSLPTEVEVAAWGARLLENERPVAILLERRAWTAEALARHEVGVDKGRLTLPMRDAQRRLVNVGRYAPKPPAGEKKLYVVRGAPRVLFPAPETVEEQEGFVPESEPDVLTATSLGLPAVGIPGVEGWKHEDAQRFAGRHVVVCLDCDRRAPRRATLRVGLGQRVRVSLTGRRASRRSA